MEKQKTQRKKQENKTKSEENYIQDASKISNEDKEMVKNNLLETVRSGQFEIELTKEEKEMPYFEAQYHKKTCPDGNCDGGGYTYQTVNKKIVSYSCTCLKKEIMVRKLKNANFDIDFFDATLEDFPDLDSLVKLNYFKPFDKPLDRIQVMDRLFGTEKGKKVTGKTKKDYEPTDEDEANIYIHKNYEIRKQSSISKFMTNYAKRILEIHEKGEKTLHLLMTGDPGKAKSYMACAIGRYFLENNKTVAYTKMEPLMQILKSDKSQENHPLIEDLKKKDLFIFDELGGEYHKENGWALKQIQNLFKERHDSNKPTIIVTNLYPHELHETYDDKIMSIFNGRFIMVQPFGEIDLRTYFRKREIDHLDFIE